MKNVIQTLYEFTPLHGDRLKTIAYEGGYAIATDGDLCVLYKHDHDPSHEGKSIDKWGDESPHIDTNEIFSTIRTFDADTDERWFVDICKANGFHWTVSHDKRPIEQMTIQLGSTFIPYERAMKILDLMNSFDINVLHKGENYLYCITDALIGFERYYETEESEITLKTTKLLKFPELEI